MDRNDFITMPYAKLAAKTKIDGKNWWSWVHGNSSPSLSSLEKAAIALDIPVVELFEAFLERRSRTMQSKQLVKSA